MADRFRDLETSKKHDRKDAVLMATVSSFEALDAPSAHAMTQFTALFVPLFQTASLAARRTASAALARCPAVPSPVAAAILRQPLDVAVPFLIHAPQIDDALLIDAMRRGGHDIAQAVKRRPVQSRLVQRLVENQLSRARPTVAVEPRQSDLIEHQMHDAQQVKTKQIETGERPLAIETALKARRKREDALRAKLRALVAGSDPVPSAPAPDQIAYPQPAAPILPTNAEAISPIGAQEEEFLKAIRKADASRFTGSLAKALDVDFARAESIMFDLSGLRLAEALVSLGLRYTLITVALETFFPHLAKGSGDARRSIVLLRGLSYAGSLDHIQAWRRSA